MTEQEAKDRVVEMARKFRRVFHGDYGPGFFGIHKEFVDTVDYFELLQKPPSLLEAAEEAAAYLFGDVRLSDKDYDLMKDALRAAIEAERKKQ